PVVDIDALMAGERKVILSTISRIDPLATITVTGSIDKPKVRVSLPSSIAPSPFTRAKPFAAYLRDNDDLLPDPINLEIRRLPPAEEAGAPGAYGGAGSIDGSIHLP
ncbi:MAG: hypothetical protein EBV84_12050, partial [Betaproteobacteria bacterium]|nr:hypothetical protein [Betaproteobacteria bacterium]